MAACISPVAVSRNYPSQTLHMAPAEHLRDPARLQATLGYRSLAAACARYPRVVALAGTRTREENLRLLAEQADAIVLLVDIGEDPVRRS